MGTDAKRNHTLMKKIITYFLIIIFSMFLINIYSSYRFKSFYNNVHTMLKRLVDIYSASVQVDKLHQHVDNYVHSGDYTYLEEYENELEALKESIARFKAGSKEEEYFAFRDIQNMIGTFDEKSRKAIKSYEIGVMQIYVNDLVVELGRLRGYIKDELKNVLVKQLSDILSYYEDFWGYMNKEERLTYVVTGLITLTCVLFAIKFSREVSVPIHQLVTRLQKVAKGDLEVERLEFHTNDEINVLIDSFNFMIVKIKNLIREIKAKAHVEKMLKEEQIKNLKISNLLNQSELKFLQSQINPHFLYNTMNTISALADIEGASQTKKMLESMSDILKYNLKKINENVTLWDEFRIVENYLYIQRARFGNRIKYSLNIDENVMDYTVPSMILQPFVENAIVHGLEPKEEKGLLEINIIDDKDDILLEVKDNGVGIEEEKIKSFFDYDDDRFKVGDKRGIGIINVIKRLEIKYGKNVVSIKSAINKGTEVSIRLSKAS